MTRVLITGFEPLDTATSHSSWDAVDLLERTWDGPAELIVRRLPAAFIEAPKRLMASIGKHLPDIVIAVGLKDDARAVTLERIALNLDAADRPDALGFAPRDVAVIEGGPLALASTLPVREIEGALREYALPVTLSTSAGSGIANHTFYALQSELERFGVPSGLIQVPDTRADQGSPAPMNLEDAAKALAIAIEVTVHAVTGGERSVHRRPSRLAPPAAAAVTTSFAAHQPQLADDDEPTQGYLPPFAEEPAPVFTEDVPTEGFIPDFAAVQEDPAQENEEQQDAVPEKNQDQQTTPSLPQPPAPVAWAPKVADASSDKKDATETTQDQPPTPRERPLTWDEIISGTRSS